MNIKFLKELKKEIIESTKLNWNLDDIIQVADSSSNASSSSSSQTEGSSEVKVIGKDIKQKSNSQQGSSKQQDSGDNQKVGQDKAKNNKNLENIPIPQNNKGSDINDPKDWMDDHSKIEKSDNTGKNIVEQAYKESEADYRKMKQKSIGSSEGGLLEKISSFIKKKFDLSKILNRLATFKRKLSEYYKRRESHVAAIFNPVTQQTNIISPGRIKEKKFEKKSALLFIALDTSGSVTSEEIAEVFGYMNDIAKQFKTRKYGIDGEVYLIEWDTRVHAPIKKWDYVNPEIIKKDLSKNTKAKMSVRGRGGTNLQALFDWLDNSFVKNIKGQNYFVFSDTMEVISGTDKNDFKNKKISGTISQRLPAKKEYKPLKVKESDASSPIGEININEGGFSNVPFLIIYTDGYVNPPNIGASKIYNANPGNILYILTTREGVKNIRPKNFVFSS